MKNNSAMKKAIQYTILVAFLVLISITGLQAQDPPHPGQTSGGGAVTGGRIGDAPAGAPIGSGTIILTLLAAAYGGKKVYNLRKEEQE